MKQHKSVGVLIVCHFFCRHCRGVTSDTCHGSTISSADCLWKLIHAQKSWKTLSIVWRRLNNCKRIVGNLMLALPPDCLPSATELFRSLLLVSGTVTVCLKTSPRHPGFLPGLVWSPTWLFSIFSSHQFCTVPAQWRFVSLDVHFTLALCGSMV